MVEEARTRNITVTDERIWYRGVGVDGHLRNRYSENGLTGYRVYRYEKHGLRGWAGSGPQTEEHEGQQSSVLSLQRPGGTVGRGEVFGRTRLIRVSMERQATRSGVQWAPTWSARRGGVEEGGLEESRGGDVRAWAGSENGRAGLSGWFNVSTRATPR